MNRKRIEDLSEEEFRGMLDYMASEEFDRLTVAEFFDVLAAMEEDEPRQTIELRATRSAPDLRQPNPRGRPPVGHQTGAGRNE